MAVTALNIVKTDNPLVWKIYWTGLAKGDTGAPFRADLIHAAGGSDRSAQIVGTFDSATITIEGSNDGTNYTTLTDPQGNALSFTTAAI